MTKHAPKLLVLLLALLIAGGIVAAKAPAEPKRYDYVSVVLIEGDLRISTGPDKFESIDAKPIGKNQYYNLTPLLGKIAELEAQGYELIESNAFGPEVPRVYALLRRPR
jgi:hypothetical protein